MTINIPSSNNEILDKKTIDTLISSLGTILHDEWRAPRKKEDGTFEPREKETKDQEWVKKMGTNKIDIANTSYSDLPEDWKGENKISAEIAIGELVKTIESGKKLDSAFIEKASDIIHIKWLERNGSWAPEEQKKSYSELSEEEKEKDRVIVKKAIEIYDNRNENKIKTEITATKDRIAEIIKSPEFKEGDKVKLTEEKIMELKNNGFIAGFPQIEGVVSSMKGNMLSVQFGYSVRMVKITDIVKIL